MTTRTLDWRPNWDARSEAHRLSVLPMCRNLRARKSALRHRTIFLDQGEEGACTGFSEETVQALTPYPQQTSNSLAQRVYEEARRQDEWPGEDYEGSSVTGAMRAAKVLGRVSEYRWARSLSEARHGASYHGAGAFGTWWYEGMWETDKNGFIKPIGEKVGGHAIAYAGFQPYEDRVRYRLENTWGEDWGDNGGCWLEEFDFLQLLNDDGELAFPVKVRN